MRRLTPHRPWQRVALAAALVAIGAADGVAIEMFTYFGDGSRIGLPSLEVPIEAYPGIPLRSDRLRARRRAMRMGPGAAVPVGPPGYARGITIRSMPAPSAATSGRPHVTTPPVVVESPAEATPAAEPLVAPEPPVSPEPPEPIDVGLPPAVTPPSVP
jgi:hypothetical protein